MYRSSNSIASSAEARCSALSSGPKTGSSSGKRFSARAFAAIIVSEPSAKKRGGGSAPNEFFAVVVTFFVSR